MKGNFVEMVEGLIKIDISVGFTSIYKSNSSFMKLSANITKSHQNVLL